MTRLSQEDSRDHHLVFEPPAARVACKGHSCKVLIQGLILTRIILIPRDA